jgi:hypothetical protein
MQRSNTRSRIQQIKARVDAQNDELMHLEQLEIQCSGQSDFVDELAERYADSWTIDGRDERRVARALSYAGFSTSWRG